MTSADASKREAARDPRLDFFRGLGMFIILIAHIPWNNWTGWIPARFGHSDATEIFVFCSGAASAIAFLKVFDARGWWTGTARIAYRIWQLYWCHIAIFFSTLTALVLIDDNLSDPTRRYVEVLGLGGFLVNPRAYLPDLFTLQYVPNLFDILVMYIGILAFVPIVVGLARVGPGIAMGFSVLVWAATSQPWRPAIDVPVLTLFDLPADRADPARTWFFNPFAWQLIFFTGFAFTAGWLPKPAVRPIFVGLAVAVLTASFLMQSGSGPSTGISNPVDGLYPLFEPRPATVEPAGAWASKTYFGPLRYVHFLALAYLAWAVAGPRGRRLPGSGPGGALVTVVRRVGQQSLAVFIASLLIAQVIGVFIAENSIQGSDAPIFVEQWMINIANISGFGLIVAVAYTARFFRNPPWAEIS